MPRSSHFHCYCPLQLLHIVFLLDTLQSSTNRFGISLWGLHAVVWCGLGLSLPALPQQCLGASRATARGAWRIKWCQGLNWVSVICFLFLLIKDWLINMYTTQLLQTSLCSTHIPGDVSGGGVQWHVLTQYSMHPNPLPAPSPLLVISWWCCLSF